MKQPLCQLSHNDCPKNLFFFFLFQDLPEPQTTSTVGRFSGLVSGPRGHTQCRGLLRKEQPVENGKVGKQNLGQGCRDSDLSLREGKLGYHQHFYKGKILGCFIKLPLTRLYLWNDISFNKKGKLSCKPISMTEWSYVVPQMSLLLTLCTCSLVPAKNGKVRLLKCR